MIDDLTELLKRIYEYGESYNLSGYKQPLFRLTPYEYKLLANHLMESTMFISRCYGDLPRYFGVDFELLGKPVLFSGTHIRSDSGIEVDQLNERN